MSSVACGGPGRCRKHDIDTTGYRTHHVRRCACWCRGGADGMRQRCLVAHAGVGAPGCSCTMCPECASHARQQPPCSPAHTQLPAQRGIPANTGHCVYNFPLQPLKWPVSHVAACKKTTKSNVTPDPGGNRPQRSCSHGRTCATHDQVQAVARSKNIPDRMYYV